MPGTGRDLKKSKEHFMKAVEYSHGKNLFAEVAYAEFYATAAGNEKLFVSTLDNVLDTNFAGDDNYALMNAIAKHRAAKLLNKKENYFDEE